MDISPNDPVYSKQVIELLTVANEYCIFTEKVEDYSKSDIINYYRHILPLLYIKGSVLKSLIPEYPEDAERFLTEESWEKILNSLRNKLYPDDHFWFCQDMRDENTDVEKMSLAECLSDIYQDMKDFVMLYQKNRYSSRENAVSEISRLFREHYGEIITRALSGLHHMEMQASSL
jgi:hypothetical protein